MGLHYAGGGTSLTALNNAFVPKWQPSHAYLAGDIVMAPDGTIVQRVSDGTSGSSYSGTNWTVVAGGGTALTSYVTQVAALSDYPSTFPSSDEVSVVTYSGSAGTTRPGAEFVVWQGFPTQPTNMADGDLWLSDIGGTIIIGTVAPTNADGADGDGWINKTTLTFYGPKASGSWPTGQALKGTDGAAGRGITSIARTSGTGAAGTTDTYTITFTDSTTTTFTVVNGSNGAGSSITVQDEGTPLTTAATTVNFVGAGVTATGTGATKTVTVPGATTFDKAALLGPTGTIRANMDRTAVGMNSVSNVSGTLYLSAVYCQAGDVLTAVNMRVGTAAAISVGTHSWGVLADSSRTVLAVSADDTTASTAVSTTKTWAFSGGAYTVPTTGLYYVGFMQAASTLSTVGANAMAASPMSIPPITSGTSNTGATTPPSVAATLTAITPVANLVPYVWLT